jgi:hypothetical protein
MSSALEDAREIRDAITDLGFDIYEPLTEHPEAVYTRGERMSRSSWKFATAVPWCDGYAVASVAVS